MHAELMHNGPGKSILTINWTKTFEIYTWGIYWLHTNILHMTSIKQTHMKAQYGVIRLVKHSFIIYEYIFYALAVFKVEITKPKNEQWHRKENIRLVYFLRDRYFNVVSGSLTIQRNLSRKQLEWIILVSGSRRLFPCLCKNCRSFTAVSSV